MSHHIVPLAVNVKTLITLVILTVVTVLTAKFVDLGEYNLHLAMFIATIKGTIVCLWFMHLKYDVKLNRVIFITAFFVLALMFGISYMDIVTR